MTDKRIHFAHRNELYYSPHVALGRDAAVTRRQPWRTRLGLVGCALVLFPLAVAVGARAEPGYKVHPGGFKLILPLRHRGKYVVSVSASERQRVQFKLEGPSSAVEYSTQGRVSRRRIEATFGAHGRIDVRLHLTHYPPGPPRRGRCRGRGPRYQDGSYSGTVDIEHDGVVPEVSKKRGHVYFTRYFRQVCKRESPSPTANGPHAKLKRRVEVGFLAVSGKSEGQTVSLTASVLTLRGSPARLVGGLAVTGYERQGEVRVARTTRVAVDRHSFAMSRRGAAPETVEVEPPPPFAGRAVYSRSPSFPPSWTGDLGVNLPGTDPLPLTGPGMDAVLCRSSWTDRFDLAGCGKGNRRVVLQVVSRHT